MTPIRVLHVRTSAGLYGAERVILNLVGHVDRARCELLLACVSERDGDGEPFARCARSAQVPVLSVRSRRKLDWHVVATLRRIIRTERVQIVHAHDFKGDLYAVLASVGLPVKRVVSAHGTTRDSTSRRVRLYLEEHLLYRAFDAVVAVAEALRAHLVAFLDPRAVILIQNGLDPALLGDQEASGDAPLTSADGRPVFAVVGRLLPDKGHRFFLDAFRKLLHTHPGCEAWIVGDGPEREAIAARVRALGLENAVRLCGTRDDMPTVYRRANCLVIPSLTEGLPMVLLEAFAWRVPVVATRVGDIPRLVEPGRSGYLVAPGDAPALARAMAQRLDSPERARAMAEAAHAILRERFTAGRMAQDTQSLYEQVLLA